MLWRLFADPLPVYGPGPSVHIDICIPVFDDWTSALMLLEALDDVASASEDRIEVWFVDDGSREEPPTALERPVRFLSAVRVLRLRRNMGHQRAIAVGLARLCEGGTADAVVVMDGDGEDDPRDVPKLIERFKSDGGKHVIFARRTKRTEGLVFRCGYVAFKVLHRVLTGRRVEVGNFSIIPFASLVRVVSVAELWNHYAAAVHCARLPTDTIPLPRARRLAGESKMNVVALVVHGLSAMSVYGEIIGVRILFLVGMAIVGVLAAIAAVVALRFGTDLAIPGWATTAAGLAVITLLNLLLFCGGAALLMLQSRMRATMVPLKDFHLYILDQADLHESAAR